MSLLHTDQIPHPDNFAFAGAKDPLTLTPLGGDVYRLRPPRARGWKNPSQAKLARRIAGENTHRVSLQGDGTLRVQDPAGRVVLAGVPRATLGRCGSAWLIQLRHETGTEFYGLGEHSRGLEKGGQRVKFWNSDLVGDYHFDQIRLDYTNPMYVSVPWLVVKRGNFYAGLLVNHPGEVFMDLASTFIWASGNKADLERRSFYLGAPDGQPDVYLVIGPDLPALTRKLQALVGRTPLPPLWSLGYHQCRWGYAGPRDLRWLDRKLRRGGFPCDGLWLDIDYMDRYKVFTFSPREWGGIARVRRSLSTLRRKGRRVVAILDPGVKVERGYGVCDDGLRRGVFCQGPTGKPFTGFAWPGHTYYPDFSRRDVRRWWARHVEQFARTGMAGAWLDMNDPSTGAAAPEAMRFNRGRAPHESYHNQYALGMAEATRAGFLAARSDERPFLISRSAFISSSRHTAVWTGDNFSNWHHLRLAIPVTLGLALSGIPFNGADVGGFAVNATRELIVAWYKAAFLFPFFRNHNAHADFVRAQEPWAFGRSAERIMARYVRLRYKFLPYLYQLFVAQEQTGEAILRPLFHDFPDRRARPLGRIEDQFMAGAALMHAPVVDEGKAARRVLLPGNGRWYALADGAWLRGGGTIPVRAPENTTPLFAREGSLVALRPGQSAEQATDLREIELHVFLAPGSRTQAVATYSADDGLSFGYQRGQRTTVRFRARLARNGGLAVAVEPLAAGYGPLRVRIVSYAGPGKLSLTTPRGATIRALRPFRWQATGHPLSVHASSRFDL
ncbi:MAG TPA: TIM-barrel domain-containing protein [Lacunisphaera sp.]|nr:TIM-barrel domain-containing protein [Lacunisphaera sp.]